MLKKKQKNVFATHQRKSFPITPPPFRNFCQNRRGGGWLGGNSKFPIEKKRSHIEAPLKIFFASRKNKGGGGDWKRFPLIYIWRKNGKCFFSPPKKMKTNWRRDLIFSGERPQKMKRLNKETKSLYFTGFPPTSRLYSDPFKSYFSSGSPISLKKKRKKS